MTDLPDDPKDDGTRVPGFTYAWMIPYLTRTARRCGYALAVHGSMSRDLDLIAVPWVQDAWEPDALALEMARMTDGSLKRNDHTLVKAGEDYEGPLYAATLKEHGRLAYTIVFKGAWHFIDLSVMPKLNTLAEYLARPSLDGHPNRQKLRAKLKELVK